MTDPCRRGAWRTLGLGLGAALLAATGCHAKGGSAAPEVDIRGMSLAEIEAELDRNESTLSNAGIMVASVSPELANGAGADVTATPTAEQEASPGPAPEPEPSPEIYDGGDEEDIEPSYDDYDMAPQATPEPMSDYDEPSRRDRGSLGGSLPRHAPLRDVADHRADPGATETRRENRVDRGA